MTMDPQPRDTLGQFSAKPNSYPEVALAENVDGSFLYPPSSWPGGLDEYTKFWRSQPISDEALTNFTSAYAATRDEWAEPVIAYRLEHWGNSYEGLAAVKAAGNDGHKLLASRNAQADLIMAELDNEYPERIAPGVVRHVARAAQMYANRRHLRSEEDRAAVLQVEVYENQQGHAFTVQELWDRFLLENIMPDAFYSRENALEKRLRDIAARLG